MKREESMELSEEEEEEENIMFITDSEVSNQLRREENAKKHALDFSQIEREREPIIPSKQPTTNKLKEGIQYWVKQPFPHFNSEKVLPFQSIYRYQFPILSSSQTKLQTSSFQPKFILQNQQRKEQSVLYLNMTDGQYSPLQDKSTPILLHEAMHSVMNQFRQESKNDIDYHLKIKLKKKRLQQEEQKKLSKTPIPSHPTIVEEDELDIFEESGLYTSGKVEENQIVKEKVETDSFLHNKGAEYQFYEVYEEDEEDDELLIQESKQKLLEESEIWNQNQEQQQPLHDATSAKKNQPNKKTKT